MLTGVELSLCGCELLEPCGSARLVLRPQRVVLFNELRDALLEALIVLKLDLWIDCGHTQGW